MQSYLSGGGTGTPVANQVLAALVVCEPGQIRQVRCVTLPGSGGGTATIIDVRKNGASVWTNPANRPTLAAGVTGVFTTYPPNNRSLRPNDVLTLVCAQAGVNAPVAATVVIEEP
jgi:hypothetical protein